MKAKRRYIYDIILVVALLALFLSLYFFVYKRDAGSDADDSDDTVYIVEVYEGSYLAGSYYLSEDGEYSVNGGTNVIRIEDGYVYMYYADCPDGWCKHQGKINIAGERITCLPNRVMLIVKEVRR
ncbi:MAG: NusG domain II-containing protein [Clostridia bacterium]|nr:NusG domain II-containing protein [Clostridia bacterium]